MRRRVLSMVSMAASVGVAVLGLAACGRKAPEEGQRTPAKVRQTAPPRTRTAPPRPREPNNQPRPTAAPASEAAFDFLLNRVSAYEYAGPVLVVSCRGPSFAKFVDGAWKNPWVLDVKAPAGAGAAAGKRGASPAGLGGTILLPVVDAGQDHVLAVQFANWLAGQAVTLMVNGKPLRSQQLGTGLVEMVFQIPAARLVKGDNAIRFVFRKSTPAPPGVKISGIVTGMGGRQDKVPKVPGVFLRLAFGPGAKLDSGPAPVRFEGKGPRATAILEPGARFVEYVLPPAGSVLSLEAACVQGSCRLEVTADTDASQGLVLARRDLSAQPATFEVGLAKVADRAARIGLRAVGGAVRIQRLELRTPKRRPVTWKKKPIRYVFLWVADTLRADMVHAFAGGPIKTPHFDAFARKAVAFSHATSPGNHSMPSHASFVTGQFPPVHGFENARRRIRPESPALYEVLHLAGWITGLFSSNGYVSDRWGFKRGLDAYRNFIREKKANATEYLWAAARKYLKGVLDTKKDRKVFLYLATIDPHVTYDPPTRYLKLYYPKAYTGPVPRRVTGFYLEKIIKGKIVLDSPEDRRYLKALYMGEVTYNDEWFGHFLEDLKKFGILDQSAVILASDHGDQFWEHGSVGHGDHLFQEEIDVPLMLWWPGLEGGQVLDWSVEAGDLMPTILDLAGVAVPKGVQYASLLPLLAQGHVPAMLAAYSFNAGRSRSVRVGRYKLIARVGTRPTLFDLKEDPREQRNLARRAPVALRLLRTVFSLQNAYLPRWRKRLWGQGSNVAPGFWTEGPGRP